MVRVRVRVWDWVRVRIRIRVRLGSGFRVKVRIKGPEAHHLAQHEDREDKPVAHLHARTRGAPLERGGPPGEG